MLVNLKFKKNLKFDRVIVGSVLQYLRDYNEVDQVFSSLKKVTSKKSKILFTQNPDILKKKKQFEILQKIKLEKV